MVKFSATEKDAPPEDQARHIAERTKTVVLSADAEHGASHSKEETLHTVDAAGVRAAWKENPGVAHEWRSWAAQQRSSQDAHAASA